MQYPHWEYFQTLVDDIDKLSRYIEITKDNYKVYSIELVRILLAVGSEVDVVAKLLCQSVPDSKPCKNINDYRTTLCEVYPSLPAIIIALPRHGIGFIPWTAWGEEQNPNWWHSYNNVKHHRDNKFEEANLINTLNAASGLCVLIGYLYHEYFESIFISSKPSLFLADDYRTNQRILQGAHYKLPDF